MKNLLTRSKQGKLVAASKRGWLKFWAVLRGPRLLLYTSPDGQAGTNPERLIGPFPLSIMLSLHIYLTYFFLCLLCFFSVATLLCTPGQ